MTKNYLELADWERINKNHLPLVDLDPNISKGLELVDLPPRQLTSSSPETNPNPMFFHMGGFPYIIHFNRMFPYKQLYTVHFGVPPFPFTPYDPPKILIRCQESALQKAMLFCQTARLLVIFQSFLQVACFRQGQASGESGKAFMGGVDVMLSHKERANECTRRRMHNYLPGC